MMYNTLTCCVFMEKEIVQKPKKMFSSQLENKLHCPKQRKSEGIQTLTWKWKIALQIRNITSTVKNEW